MTKETNTLITLFKVFFKIGVFTLGGGYAMIPIIEEEVVKKHAWLTKESFIDIIAIAQSCPGAFAINLATSTGYKIKGQKGAFYATLGSTLPSFVIILLIAMIFRHFMDIPWIAAMFRGIRPAVVALIAVPTFNLARDAHMEQRMDTCCMRLADMGTARKPHLDYHCSWYWRTVFWQIN